MYRYASLTAVLAALLLPGAATASDVGSSDDLMAAYFGDHEISLAAPVSAPVAAAAAAATQAPDYDLSASLAVQDPLAQPDQFAALSDEELGGQRGGFMTPLGLEVGFGAIVRTTIDGALAHIRHLRELQPDEWFETPKPMLLDAVKRAAVWIRKIEEADGPLA